MKLQLMTILGSIGGGGDTKPLEEEIERLTLELQQAYEDLGELQRQKDILEAQYGEALDQIQEQQTAIANYVLQIQALNEQIQNLGRQISELNRDLNTLQMLLDQKDRELEQKDVEIGELTAQVGALQVQVTELQAQVTDLQAQVQTLGAQITALQIEIQQKDEYIAYLEEHQGGGDVPTNIPYDKVKKLGDYTYEMTYSNPISLEKANELLADYGDTMGGCSVYCINDNEQYTFGHNYDWKYDESAVLAIKTPARDGKYAVTGIAGSITGVTQAIMDAKVNHKGLQVAPWLLVDGMNEQRLSIAVNVVPRGDNGNNDVVGSGSFEINTLAVVRYVLENFKKVSEVKSWFTSPSNKFVNPQSLLDAGYELHWMVKERSYDNRFSTELAFVNGNAVTYDTPNSYSSICSSSMTNFVLQSLKKKPSRTDTWPFFLTPATQSGDQNAYDTQGVSLHGMGLERQNLLRYPGTGGGTVKAFLDNVKYTNLYTLDENRWDTELCSSESGLTVKTPTADFDATHATIRAEFANRKRDGKTWHTVHSAIYSSSTLTVSLYTQEDDKEYVIGFTSMDSDGWIDDAKRFHGTLKNQSAITFLEDVDASEITNADNMFKGQSNITFRAKLPNVSSARYTFYDIYSLNVTLNMPKVVDIQYICYKSGATINGSVIVEGELPLVRWAYESFSYRSVADWTIDMPSLESANYAFRGAGITHFKSDMPKLTSANNMFYLATSLRDFEGDLSSLTNGSQMFDGYNYGNYGNMTTFKSGLPSLTNGSNMFRSQKLSHASVKRIADSINDLASQGKTGSIYIGVNQESLSEDKQAEYNTQIVNKGWTVTWQRLAPPSWWTPDQDEPVEEPEPEEPEEPEEPTDGITIPADAVKVGTYSNLGHLYELKQLIGEDNINAVNNGDKVLYIKYYDFLDWNNDKEPTQWLKVNISGDDIYESNIEVTDEARDYVVIRYTKADISNPESPVITSTDIGTVNGSNVIPGYYVGDEDVSNFAAFFVDMELGNYISVSSTYVSNEGGIYGIMSNSADYYLADN